MGNLEKENRREIRNSQIKKIILGTVATAGLLSAVVLAPNIIQIFAPFIKDKRVLRNKKYYINSSRQRLVSDGLLKYDVKGYLHLTEAGEKELSELKRREYKITKPKKWDKKWRMLIFDIREDKRVIRDQLRKSLVSIGFIHLQDSVWVYPYDCEDFITLLKADFEIGKDLLYLIVDKIENDKEIRGFFGL